MKRTLITSLLFLLAGAIINVAVAPLRHTIFYAVIVWGMFVCSAALLESDAQGSRKRWTLRSA